jgi:hypothetical protein
MPEEKKKKALWVDEDTHAEVAIMAAKKRITIKECLAKLIEKAKEDESD